MENSIYKTFLHTCLLLLLIGLSSFTLKTVIRNRPVKTAAAGFAVLELFTSQGCSSCPPADEVLAKYAMLNNPNIIPLAFHVDYWNYIGWKDPFSKAQFTERQRDYASLLNVQGNYTPQMVVNGRHQLVGSNKNAIESLVNNDLSLPARFKVSLTKSSVSDNELNVEYDADNNPNTVINLALVKKKESTSIKRGENSGLTQTSYNIVFDFKTIKSYSATNNKTRFPFHTDWLPADFMVVAYLQNANTGAIIGATKSEINSIKKQ